MTIKITQLGNLTGVYGNTIVPVVANVGGVLTTVKGNLDQFGTWINQAEIPYGNIIPLADAVYSFGTPSYRFKNLFLLGGSAIYLGNATLTEANSSIQSSLPITANIVSANLTISGNAFSLAGETLQISGGVFQSSVPFDGNVNTLTFGDGTSQSSAYSNVQVATYLPTYTGNIANIRMEASGGVTFADGSRQTSAYSNVQTATYLAAYSGNIANVRLGISGVLTFADGTTMTTAATGGGGGSNYSNVNVASYLGGTQITVANILLAPSGNITFADSTTLSSAATFIGGIQTVTDAGTVTPNASTDTNVDITALAQGVNIANPTGTSLNFQRLVIRIKDNGSPRSISWDTDYQAGGQSLPTTTVAGKTITLGFIYNTANSLNKWQLVAKAQET